MTCKVITNKHGVAFICSRNGEAPTEEDKRKIDEWLTEFYKKSAAETYLKVNKALCEDKT